MSMRFNFRMIKQKLEVSEYGSICESFTLTFTSLSFTSKGNLGCVCLYEYYQVNYNKIKDDNVVIITSYNSSMIAVA